MLTLVLLSIDFASDRSSVNQLKSPRIRPQHKLQLFYKEQTK
jgi:hypothetical protein